MEYGIKPVCTLKTRFCTQNLEEQLCVASFRINSHSRVIIQSDRINQKTVMKGWLSINNQVSKYKMLIMRKMVIMLIILIITMLIMFIRLILFVSWIASESGRHSSSSHSDTSFKIAQRISCALHQENARAILKRAPEQAVSSGSSLCLCLLSEPAP